LVLIGVALLSQAHTSGLLRKFNVKTDIVVLYFAFPVHNIYSIVRILVDIWCSPQRTETQDKGL